MFNASGKSDSTRDAGLGARSSVLALNGVIGLAGHAIDLSSPWYDVAATAAMGLLVAVACRGDWPALQPLLRTCCLDPQTWWQPVVHPPPSTSGVCS
jgi:hypothetical protein